jgi:hypothetical protein
MRRITLFACAALCAMTLVAGCARKPMPVMERPSGTLAVAGFTHPKYNWQLLAGYIPIQGAAVDGEIIAGLDAALEGTLSAHGVSGYISPLDTRKCQEIVTFQNEGERVSALKYWTAVGRCAKADYLLVPQVLSWHEREGQEMGVTRPAGVTLDFYYIDVNAGTVAVRRQFDEVQSSLSEDLGNAGKFFDRGGKWITASQLAEEGIDVTLTEMGL